MRSAGRWRGVAMATEVKLPRLGQGMESGTIVRWLKTEGDAVSKGEPLFELDTDKVTQEVEADSDGVLLKIVIADGEVDVGTTVAIIGAQDEDVSSLLSERQRGRARDRAGGGRRRRRSRRAGCGRARGVRRAGNAAWTEARPDVEAAERHGGQPTQPPLARTASA